jgi:hypothetical protein
MNDDRWVVDGGDFGFRFAGRRADGKCCCAADDLRHLCGPCKGAHLAETARRRAAEQTIDGAAVPRPYSAALERRGLGATAAVVRDGVPAPYATALARRRAEQEDR